MPDKRFKIVSSTIDQDQYDVAAQWAKTFLHNSTDDVAIKMSQLVMACVAMGDFKTRAYMSKSSELQAPSDQLTVADYLSHASRIILDYQDMSESNRAELLAYFPAPGETNTVFARSATHNVFRTERSVFEGKGVLLGVTGQLPSILKESRDFGVNIAMGGAGENNHYGKKISANGFSGHLYFHLNKEQNILLVGLEQSAPAASPLELLKGAKKYSEVEQQDTDQFGQGHSLIGASDTYTAAGSLYFSNPVYQAKLVLEKGCFPPEKYGAMKVIITDENWPAIKYYLERLRYIISTGSQEILTEQLLEKPTSAISYEKDFLSYIALNFDAYLKQIYQVFILQSESSADERILFEKLQTDLLVIIKKLQIGTLDSYDEFNLLVNQIATNPDTPEEYCQAIARISALFKLHLEIDPKLKQTQVTPEYQFGDITRTMLGKISGEEGYKFGDVTRFVVCCVTPTPSVPTASLSEQDKQEEPAKKTTGYRFGDYTRSLFGSGKTSETPEPPQDNINKPGF
ncbi:hypothetical protein TUM19329_08020 [Legionella antarctica]|uniref:Uncharacterized protein n=1 Tax=Legionella antarctica TaxID=2708020 RepID=A0A6F8T1V1_9GAMM|nr:hypothetical protein [Legionella antarctica]BCA94441.1 hypothetical protein TUM19329_08020 [Legionella antarctica]